MKGEIKILKCACGAPYDYGSVALWFPDSRVHHFTHSLVIMTRQYCCGALNHTEPVATISSYLRNVKANARMVCNLINQHLLAGRPQPEWLNKAWTDWEEAFEGAPRPTPTPPPPPPPVRPPPKPFRKGG